MATVAETELEQRMSEFILFVRDFAENHEGDFKIILKSEGAVLLCVDKEVTMDFSV